VLVDARELEDMPAVAAACEDAYDQPVREYPD